MGSRTTLSAAGFDLSTLGLRVETVGGWRAGSQSWRSAVLLGRAGAALLDRAPTEDVRKLTVTGRLFGTSRADVDARFVKIVARLNRGEVKLITVDAPTLEFRGYLESWAIEPGQPQLIEKRPAVTFTFVCLDPWLYATSDTVVPFTTATAMPLGSAPSLPVITLTGVGAGAVLTYKDSLGVTKGALTLTTAGTYTLDMAAGTIVRSAANAMADLVLGSLFPLALDPVHGETYLDVPTYPTLAVSSGAGSASYRKGYR